jgi:hypothetical protein
MASTPDVRGATNTELRAAGRQGQASPTPLTPLFAPTQRPDEPITSGIDMGPGAGSSALMMRKSSEKLSDVLVKMIPYDTDGTITILYQEALARGN